MDSVDFDVSICMNACLRSCTDLGISGNSTLNIYRRKLYGDAVF